MKHRKLALAIVTALVVLTGALKSSGAFEKVELDILVWGYENKPQTEQWIYWHGVVETLAYVYSHERTDALVSCLFEGAHPSHVSTIMSTRAKTLMPTPEQRLSDESLYRVSATWEVLNLLREDCDSGWYRELYAPTTEWQ